ncbi:hypothetical protein Calag_1095 [Caldisphaera lagunensis DSM 15908]|uniref:RecA-superfamily ATPase possibly involved in signal transduction n=1 Tax=Caldisphaera lagunensis (strain DSM 15908 / JCM 11604 / ANMR 0165 / IC-154) TaxID=1056495 RepID=L0ACF3_CALLD|nr:hypothetical protein [Caldisphaera lagunensis]AFZ70817.1 hypothetical protein Calag_1095 [Caldisphaera lagunensis DSM 15908]
MYSLTGIQALDTLINPINKGNIIEIYGDWRIALSISHMTMASLTRYGKVGVVYIQDFGNLDPYFVRKMIKIFGGNFDNIYISRAFRRYDIPELIKSIEGINNLILIDPYLFSPVSPLNYNLLTPITGAIKEISSKGITAIIFNRETSLGKFLPEGGKFHHHILHAIIKVLPYRNGIEAILIKHYAKLTPRISYISYKELGDERLWVGQHLLQEWL